MAQTVTELIAKLRQLPPHAPVGYVLRRRGNNGPMIPCELLGVCLHREYATGGVERHGDKDVPTPAVVADEYVLFEMEFPEPVCGGSPTRK